MVYCAWLSEEFGVDMEETYLTRFVGSIKRLNANKISPDELQELEEFVIYKFKK